MDKYYRVCDMHLLAWLLYKGYKQALIELDTTSTKGKLWFLFDDTQELRIEISDFQSNKLIQDYLVYTMRAKLLINQCKNG